MLSHPSSYLQAPIFCRAAVLYRLLIFLNLTVKGFWQDTIGNPQAFAPDANAGENYPPNPNGAAPAPYRQPPQQQGMNQAPMGGYQNPNPGPSMYGANAGAPVNAYGGNQYGAPPGGNMQQNPYGGPPPAQRSTYGAPPAASGAMLGNVPPQQGGGGYGGPPPKGSYGGGGGGGRMAPMGGGPQYGMVGSAIVRDEAPARIIPISALNPYQGRWTIKARCTQKSEIRRYAAMSRVLFPGLSSVAGTTLLMSHSAAEVNALLLWMWDMMSGSDVGSSFQILLRCIAGRTKKLGSRLC